MQALAARLHWSAARGCSGAGAVSLINRVLVNYSSIARGVVGKCSAALRKLKRNFQPKRVQRVNEAIKLVRNSRLFDSAFYLSTYPDLAAAAIDPAEHYFLCGATEGRNPGPLFSTSEYLQQNPDVATAKLNALYHYEFRGREEGRLLRSPLTDEAIDIIRRSSLFDLGFYLRTYPDLAVAGVDSAMHYFRHGAEEGRNPGPLFFTSEYLLRNPDVALANVNPLYHYETQGREEKRPMRLHQHEAIELIRSSPLFDPEFYLSVYPDLAASAVDPAAHYFLHGAEEGRNPGPLFFTSEYLRQNPDVAAANMNALYHYESRGREEGRPVPRQQAVPLSEHSEMRRRLIEALGYYRYITCHPDLEGPGQSPLDISVSAVIPTYNAGSELGPLVRKLLAQKGLKSVEVVIVDSGSTDGTAEFSVELGCKLVKITQTEFSHSYSRNVGADASIGDLLVFMVQDAYPIGEYWLFGLARCLFRPQVKEAQLSAVSCAEYPRAASELFYDSLSKRHYEFIGCSGKDRVGYLSSDDHVSLRMQGQLSDVACAIPREVFNNYRYIGS
jgi:hypothetical protein